MGIGIMLLLCLYSIIVTITYCNLTVSEYSTLNIFSILSISSIEIFSCCSMYLLIIPLFNNIPVDNLPHCGKMVRTTVLVAEVSISARKLSKTTISKSESPYSQLFVANSLVLRFFDNCSNLPLESKHALPSFISTNPNSSTSVS